MNNFTSVTESTQCRNRVNPKKEPEQEFSKVGVCDEYTACPVKARMNELLKQRELAQIEKDHLL